MRKNIVVITTDNSVLMRGTNFRGKEHGIDLLIAAPLPNDRAYIQALGRVQRAGDQGKRYRLKNVTEVDKDKRVELLSKLYHRTQLLESKKMSVTMSPNDDDASERGSNQEKKGLYHQPRQSLLSHLLADKAHGRASKKSEK